MIVPVELHQAGVRNAFGEITHVAAKHVAVTATVQQQRRRLNAFEHRTRQSCSTLGSSLCSATTEGNDADNPVEREPLKKRQARPSHHRTSYRAGLLA